MKNKKREKGLSTCECSIYKQNYKPWWTVHEKNLERAFEETGSIEHGEIIFSAPLSAVNTVAVYNVQNF